MAPEKTFPTRLIPTAYSAEKKLDRIQFVQYHRIMSFSLSNSLIIMLNTDLTMLIPGAFLL